MAKEKKTKTRTRLPHAPKKPPSSYLTFCSNLRKSDAATLKALSPPDQRDYFSKRWRTIAPHDKTALEDEYRARMVTYKREFEAYKESELYKEDLAAMGQRKGKKRVKSAYNIFLGEEYRKLSAEKKGNEKISFGENTAILSKKWNSMNEEEKMVYKRKAEELRKENHE